MHGTMIIQNPYPMFFPKSARSSFTLISNNRQCYSCLCCSPYILGCDGTHFRRLVLTAAGYTHKKMAIEINHPEL